MINVECDIGKTSLDVYFEGKSRRYKNDKTGIEDFVKLCLKNESNRVVLEPTRGYERVFLAKLHEQGIATAVVNPYYVRNFAESYRDLAKTGRRKNAVRIRRENESEKSGAKGRV